MTNAASEACTTFFMIFPRKDPIFGFEGLSKTVETLGWRNNYVSLTDTLNSHLRPHPGFQRPAKIADTARTTEGSCQAMTPTALPFSVFSASR